MRGWQLGAVGLIVLAAIGLAVVVFQLRESTPMPARSQPGNETVAAPAPDPLPQGGHAATTVSRAGTAATHPATRRAAPTTQPEATLPVGQPDHDWPIFRGGSAMLGLATGTLPDKPVLKWKFKTEDAVNSSAVVAAGRVFIGSNDGNVYALDLASGQKIWAFKTEDIVEAPPMVLGDTVYVGSADQDFYALDAATGNLRWSYATEGKIVGSANALPGGSGQATRIVVGSYDNKIHCIDAATGQGLWTYTTSNFVNGSPAIAKGQIVFGGCDEFIRVLDGRGDSVAEIQLPSNIPGTVALAEGQVFTGHYGNAFVCADLAKHQVVWSYHPGRQPFFSSAAILVQGDKVVFGGRDRRVHCVNRLTGKPIWTFRTGGDVDSSPVICGAKVVVGSNDGVLYILNLADGKKLGSYEIGSPVVSSPAVAGGCIIVGADDGYVYCFGNGQ